MEKTKLNLIGILIPILLVSFVFYLFFENYTPGTFLTGWDTLHPEFNFDLAFRRMISGVWREDQGLGTIAAHAHMADLPRVVFLYLASFIFPTEFLRYFYILVSMIMGTLGIYILSLQTNSKERGVLAYLSALIGSVFYLLNIGTLQHFFVPFEMFAVQFAFLPWLFLFSWTFLSGGSKKSLLLLIVTSIAASPMAYAPALFYAYFGAIFILITFNLLLVRQRASAIKRGLLVLFAIIFTNLFWLAPNIYSVINQSPVISVSKINSLFSPEAFLFNKSYGTVDNVAINRNFLFSWKGYDFEKGEFSDLLGVWKNHLSAPFVLPIAYFFALTGLLGIVVSFAKNNRFGICMTGVAAFSLFFLINENPPTGFIYSFINKNFPIFGEGFRMVFTKFSILYIFATAYFISYFIFFIFNLRINFQSIWGKIFLLSKITVGLALISLNIYYMLPAFRGNFISEKVRINIPNEYFRMYKFIGEKKVEGKIVKFPMDTPFNWEYHDWGYEGSGWFTWFSIRNAQLDRDFDRFSQYNESFYNELSDALYTENVDTFIKLSHKFKTNLFLLDESVINPLGASATLFVPQIKQLLANDTYFEKVHQENFLSLYRLKGVSESDVYLPERYLLVDRDVRVSRNDQTYLEHGDYVNSDTGILYPFRDLDVATDVDVSKKGDAIEITHTSVNSLENRSLFIPNFLSSVKRVPISVYMHAKENVFYLTLKMQSPNINIGGREYGGDVVEKIYPIKYNNKPTFISIDDTVFPVKNISETKQFVGGVYVESGGYLKADLYLDNSIDDEAFLENLLVNELPRLCSDTEKKTERKPISENGFQMQIRGESACLGTSISLSSDSLIALSFESKSEDDIFPQVCISGKNYRRCLSEKISEAYLGNNNGNRKFEIRLPLTAGEYYVDFVGLPRQDKKVNIIYDKIRLTRYPVNFIGLIPITRDFSELLLSKTLTVDNPVKEIKTNIPLITSINENLTIGRGHPSGFNCDVLDVGEAIKLVDDNGVTYTAKSGAASCDYYDYPQLYYDQGYLLNVVGKNQLGRGLKFYLFDRVNYNTQFQELLTDSKFDSFYWIYPKNFARDEGYSFNTEVRSFGEITGESTVSGITFFPIPLSWLEKISLTFVDSSVVTSDLTLNGYEKKGNYIYEVNLGGNTGVVSLNQGYEKGWIGLDVTGGFWNAKRLDHVKVNSWANGFQIKNRNTDVDGGLSTDDKSNEVAPRAVNHKIVIVFWPQYLEFFGFFTLSVGIIWFLFFYRDKHPRLKKAIRN